MNNWVLATPESGRVSPPEGRLRANAIPMLLLLGGFLFGLSPARGATPLVLNQIPINPTNVMAGSVLNLQITYANTDILPPDAVIFRPLTGAPEGATIDSSGAFRWLPTASQVTRASGTNITVWAFEQLQPANSNFVTFRVIVTSNVPPVSQVVIDPIPPQTVAEGMTLIFTNHAQAADNPSAPLWFRLINEPSGATLTNNSLTSGVFTWTPTAAQAATPSYTLREIVTEVGGSGSNYQDFQVTIVRTNNCADLDAFLAAVQQGGYFLISNCTTIVLSNTLTISNSNTTLDGGTKNVTIAGNNLLRLFTVLPGVTNFTLRGLTLSGGRATHGGSLYINPGAVVMLTNCTFAGNGAVGANGTDGNDASGGGTIGNNGGNGTAGSQALGGAIYNLGDLMIYNSSFFTNRAAGGSGGSGGNGSDGTAQGGNGGNGGAGALACGGAIYSLGTLWLTNCTFSGNTVSGGTGGSGGSDGVGPFPGDAGHGGAGAAGSGAAIYSGQSLTANNCTFAANAAQSGNSVGGGTDPSSGSGVNGSRGPDSLGGGVYVRGSGALNNCTFANNTVAAGNGGNGGDAYPIGVHTAGNGGNGGNGMGGGLYSTGTVTVVNCTFAGCGAAGGINGGGGGGAFPGKAGTPGAGRGGDIANASGAFLLRNSILAASSAGTNAYDTSASRITDGGFNISSDASLNLSGTSSKNTDPKIGSLADNGGPTQTMALQTNSPALDRIPLSLSPLTDQRGVQRPQGAACDIGAYEWVRPPPVILTQPKSQTNAIGTPVTFTVSANGEPLGYQWRFNSAAITNATAASYTVSSVDQTNAGSYDVIVANSSGSVTSAVAKLTVLVAPAITTQPSNQVAAAGDSVMFSVTATGTAPLIYQWRFQGTNLAGATAGTLQLTNVQSSNAGSYAVTITNVVGSVTSATANLTIASSPVIRTIQPTSQSVPAGSAATFTVSAAGTAPLAYQWQFNGTPIANATNSSYILAKAQTTNSGSYTVVVTNVSGSTNSAPVTLIVYSLPHLAVQPDGSVQLVFAPTLNCQVQASTNLGDWVTSFTTNAALADMPLLEFTDTNAGSPPLRFYRVGQTLAGHPALTNFFVTDQLVSLDCAAAPVLACQIEASTNLTSWSLIFTTNFSNAVSFQFRFAEATNSPTRFYRLSQTPGF